MTGLFAWIDLTALSRSNVIIPAMQDGPGLHNEESIPKSTLLFFVIHVHIPHWSVSIPIHWYSWI